MRLSTVYRFSCIHIVKTLILRESKKGHVPEVGKATSEI